MLTQEQDRLYGLALRLVPDPDVAGDLFMDAQDEADLRRRASRWRKQHGLPEGDPIADLAHVHLSEAEREHAAHLARRGGRRRKARGMLAGLLAGAVALGALYALQPALRAPSALAMAAQFEAQPVAATTAAGGVKYMVYRAEATPVTLTLWWAVEGPGADRLGPAVTPALLGHSDQQVTPDTNEITVSSRSRVLGRSTFDGAVRENVVRVAFTAPLPRGAGNSGWSLGVPVERVVDPGAREITVNRTLTVPYWGVDVRVLSVAEAPDYTLVRYKAEGADYTVWQANVADVEADGQPQVHLGDWSQGQGADERVAVYAPVPAGASGLTIHFRGLAYPVYEEREYPLPDPALFPEWHRSGNRLNASFLLPQADAERTNEMILWAVDRAGQTYTLLRSQAYSGAIGLNARGLPPDDQLVALKLGLWRTSAPPEMQIGL